MLVAVVLGVVLHVAVVVAVVLPALLGQRVLTILAIWVVHCMLAPMLNNMPAPAAVYRPSPTAKH
eukprot:12166654-Alexandrium_andersonii.AAC.1